MQDERKASGVKKAQEWSENRWIEGSNGDLSMYRGDLSMHGGKTEGFECAQRGSEGYHGGTHRN